MRYAVPILILVFLPTSWAFGQSSSLYRAHLERETKKAEATTKPTKTGALRTNAGTTSTANRPRNEALAAVSLTAVSAPKPVELKVNDLIGVIVRHRYSSQTDAKMEQSSEWDVESQLDAWFRIHDRKWLAQDLAGGKPQVGFSNKNDLENEGKVKRTDVLETRLKGRILDVKPNGNLFIVASYQIGTDDDVQRLVLSGIVSPKDITVDGSVTSDKIAELKLDTKPEGSVYDAVKRGWLKEALDAIKPF